jgi:outer membrane murein-binding lipoprotein Lpp
MQCSDDLRDLNLRVAAVESDVAQLKTAFPHNDLGREDYDGHRKDHYHRTKAAEEDARAMSELKNAATKRLLVGAIGLAITVIGFGLGPYVRSILGGP